MQEILQSLYTAILKKMHKMMSCIKYADSFAGEHRKKKNAFLNFFSDKQLNLIVLAQIRFKCLVGS